MSEYRINDTTKWGMLTLAFMFDGVQFITPNIMDKMIIALAFFVFGMWFLEKGAFTWRAPDSKATLLKIFRYLGPIMELIISNAPMITLIVASHIYMSRIWDKTLGEKGVEMAGLLTLKKDIGSINKNRQTYKHQKKQIKKYAYGKGRRGAQTLKHKMGIKNSTKTSRVQRKLDTQKVV